MLVLSRRLAAAFLAGAMAFAILPTGASAHGYKVGAIEIGHPWSRAMAPSARTGVGYLSLANHGAEPDRLVSISSPAADRVSIHDMSVDNGVMTMREVEGGLAIPAGGEAQLAPGGLHLMLTGVKEPFEEGQMVPVELTFEKAGPIEVQLKVDAMGAKDPHGNHKP